jgi:hypothetical protein
MTADPEPEKPLELIFRPTHGVAIVYLRNPALREAEIAYLKDKLPDGVEIRVDPKLDYVLLKPDLSTLRQMMEFAGTNRMWRWPL